MGTVDVNGVPQRDDRRKRSRSIAARTFVVGVMIRVSYPFRLDVNKARVFKNGVLNRYDDDEQMRMTIMMTTTISCVVCVDSLVMVGKGMITHPVF